MNRRPFNGKTNVAIAMSVIALGSATGIFIAERNAVERAAVNGCVLRGLVDESLRTNPNAPYAERFKQLRESLHPTAKECPEVLEEAWETRSR